jgi:DNA repair exonuclease SbcCD ATPase subunit
MKIKKIVIKNFKNMVEYSHNFDGKQEIIRAEFGGGKSTIFEAYKWVMGYDVPNFEPTIDRNLIAGIKTDVYLVFEKDNLEFALQRASMRKNGTVVGAFAYCGNPCKSLKEYRSKIEDLFGIPHADIELLIDIRKFNSTDTTKWTWKEQREFLFRILGIEKAIQSVIDKEEYAWIKEQFIRDRKLTEIDILKKLAMDKRTIEKQIDANMAIIDNNANKIAEYKSIDFDALHKEKDAAVAELDKLDSASAKAKKSEVVAAKSKEIDKLYAVLTELNKEKADFSRKLIIKQREVYQYSDNNSQIISHLKELDEKIVKLKDERTEIEKRKFDESLTVCQFCGAQLSEDKVEERKAEFEKNKLELLETNEEELKDIVYDRNNGLAIMNENKADYEKAKAEYDGMKAEFDNYDVKISETESQISALRKEMDEVKTAEANSEIRAKQQKLSNRIDEINAQLRFEPLVADLTAENDRLKENNRESGIAEQKRLQREDLVNQFINEKMEIVSKIVEEKFTGVSFQFFKYNRTDGEQKNICAVLYKGSDYSQCSFGQKIALNFLLNESLQNIFQSDFPVWVDDVGSAKVFESKHQFIGLLTDNTQKLEYIRVRDKYTLDDCENLG